MFHFLPLENIENRRFFDIFKEYRSETLDANELKVYIGKSGESEAHLRRTCFLYNNML